MPIVYDPILGELETDPVPGSSGGGLANPVLEELHNVVIQDAAPGQVLQYDGSVWRNVTMAIAGAVLLYASVLAAAPTAVEAYFPTEQVSHYDPVDPASPTVIEARYPAEQVSYYDPVTESTPSLITAYVPPEQAIAYGTVTFPPPPEPPAQEFIIKEFLVDDRYDDGWVKYGDSVTNGDVVNGNWISDSSYMFQHGLLKYATLGVGSFLEVKFQFSETAIGLNFEIGFHSSINTSRIFTYMQPDTFDFIVCDSMGNGVANETTTPVFEPYIFKIEALESLVPGKILARYSMNGTTKFEEYVDQSAFDCIYIVMNSAYSDPISVDYIKYKIA